MKSYNNKRQKTNNNQELNKHVSWGEVTVNEIPVVASKKVQIKEKLKNLDLSEIDNLLQQNNEDSKELYSNSGIFAILDIANNCAQSSTHLSNYNSELFKSIVLKLKQHYDKDISNILVGYRIHLISKKHSDIENKVFSDFLVATKSNFDNIVDCSHPSVTNQELQKTENSPDTGSVNDKENLVTTNSDITHTDGGAAEGHDSTSSTGDETASQRSTFLTGINDADKKKTDSNAAKDDLAEDESYLSVVMFNSLSWIYELPEWMQEQILNSTPIKTIIEETETLAAIYDSSEYVLSHLNNMFATEKATSCDYDVVAKQEDKVTFIDSAYRYLVDTTMILEDTQVTGLILPMVDINSGNILGENEFGTHANFNGLNGLEVF